MDRSLLLSVVRQALRTMGYRRDEPGPLRLASHLESAIQAFGYPQHDGQSMIDSLLSDDPNDSLRLVFGDHIRAWDTIEDAQWSEGTIACSLERRRLICSRLDLSPLQASRCDQLFPVPLKLEHATVIAEDHREWYSPERRHARSFYWREFCRHLEASGWPASSIAALDDSTTAIVERLSDPERPEIFQTKGLVVGYVQSGKTANFTGVIARAADAGYRLFIVLAGTLNVLREQTQRRIDKELIGRELLEAEAGRTGRHDYLGDPDWCDFVAHQARPSELGSVDFTRLTGPTEDYRALGRGIQALEFPLERADRRFNDPINLHAAPAKLLIIKKNAAVIDRLQADLERLSTPLDEVPSVVIDDESDQASIDTRRPSERDRKTRNAVNGSIVRLLATLKRAQYIGYTATPFANVFIDPSDAEDLFPKDYILALGRPHGYMGIRDFFDISENGVAVSEVDRPPGFASNERAYLRDVRGDDDASENIPKALDSFVLAGALKLFRKARVPALSFRHHTMLVHRSHLVSQHRSDAELVLRIWDSQDYGAAQGYDRLAMLWEQDFALVCKAKGQDLPQPRSFVELKPFIDECLSLVRATGKPVLVVNGDEQHRDDTPNFERQRVWNVLVGGTKLSRGYTVEGLTVSYYRRKSKTADTLMQMGRWFGFRRGYSDLVRLFIGRAEPDGRGKTFDLYEAFKAICQDEEIFRRDLDLYSRQTPRITPRQIPPLVPSHLLRPAAKNKMYNAVVSAENFGGRWVQPTVTPTASSDLRVNCRIIKGLVSGTRVRRLALGARVDGVWIDLEANVAKLARTDLREALGRLRWTNQRRPLERFLRFLDGTGERDPGIDSWLLIAPQLVRPKWLWGSELRWSVVERSRVGERFGVFSDPKHQRLCEVIAEARDAEDLTEETAELRSQRLGVLLTYPVVESGSSPLARDSIVDDGNVAIGFAIFSPPNRIPGPPVVFSVVDPSHPDMVVVDASHTQTTGS